jgi:hypothetical protein
MHVGKETTRPHGVIYFTPARTEITFSSCTLRGGEYQLPPDDSTTRSSGFPRNRFLEYFRNKIRAYTVLSSSHAG